jgi:hypothetical protein
MASATSVRDYTSSDLGPLLELKKRFLAETVPAFGAVSTLNRLKQSYPDYTYWGTARPSSDRLSVPAATALTMSLAAT